MNTIGVPTRPRSADLELSGAEIIAEILAFSGVDTVFAYPGTSELPLCDAFERQPGVTLLNARGDKEAAFMAGGGNFLRPGACAAILHGARGSTNALGAIADLRRSELALLCVVGMPSRASIPFLPPHGEPDLMASLGIFARACHDLSGENIGLAALTAAVAAAVRDTRRRPCGPVLLGVPQDVFGLRFSCSADHLSPDLDVHAPSDEFMLDEAADLLISARRPVIFVDDYALGPRGATSEELATLAVRLGAPIFQVSYGRGPMLFPSLPAGVAGCRGAYDPGDAAHREAMDSADALITIEDRNMYPRVVGNLPTCAKVVLTSNRRATLKNGYVRPSDLVVELDAGAAVRGLLARLPEDRLQRCPPPLPSAPASAAHPVAAAMVQALGAGAVAASATVVDDSQMFGGLAALAAPALKGLRLLGSHGGFVGGGMATAAGMALSNPDSAIICTVGDHGFTNALQAMASLSGRSVRLVYVVCNNRRSVSLRKQALHDGLDVIAESPFLMNPGSMSYAAIAAGFGLAAEAMDWRSEGLDVEAQKQWLRARLLAMLGGGRPALLELETTDDPAFWTGVWNVEGFEAAATPAPDVQRT